MTRLTRFVLLGPVILAVLLIVLPVGMGWLTLWLVTHPVCSPGPAPEVFGLEPEAVGIPSQLGITFDGCFFSGTNGATIVIPPAYGHDRGGLLHEAAVLIDYGYSVLIYDSRPCSGTLPHSLGPREARDVLDAVAYLETRPDIDSTRIGVLGFSQAGASSVFAAAESPMIRAVVVEGGYVDYAAQTLGAGGEQDVFTALFTAGARLGYRTSTGARLADLRLWDALYDIAPRPILLVYGEHEITLAGARQAADLGEHIALWEVSGASHGDYLARAGEAEFARQVVGFFDDALVAE